VSRFALVALRIGLLGFVVGVVWLSNARPASANHYTYLGEGANQGQFGLNTAYTWVFKTWAIEGQTTRYCNGLYTNQATFDAIADWESRFAFPWNEFTYQCGSAQRMDIVDNIGWSGMPTWCVVACAVPYWIYDSTREGWYVDYFRIWVNERDYNFNYFGMRATIAHELGHVYGLNEQYLDSQGGFACNNSINSIIGYRF